MSASKAERAAREQCRSDTTEKLLAKKKARKEAKKLVIGELNAINRELHRRRSEQWAS